MLCCHLQIPQHQRKHAIQSEHSYIGPSPVWLSPMPGLEMVQRQSRELIFYTHLLSGQ